MSPENYPESDDLGDGWDPMGKPVVLSPTILGDVRVDYGPAYYFLRRAAIRELLQLGRYASLQWEDQDIPKSGCERHPNGSAIILSMPGEKRINYFIIPRKDFLKVVYAEVQELVVLPCREEA